MSCGGDKSGGHVCGVCRLASSEKLLAVTALPFAVSSFIFIDFPLHYVTAIIHSSPSCTAPHPPPPHPLQQQQRRRPRHRWCDHKLRFEWKGWAWRGGLVWSSEQWTRDEMSETRNIGCQSKGHVFTFLPPPLHPHTTPTQPVCRHPPDICEQRWKVVHRAYRPWLSDLGGVYCAMLCLCDCVSVSIWDHEFVHTHTQIG